jgi:hypothetical protein
MQVGQGIGQYDALRRELGKLQDLFSYAATYTPVYSQLISPLDGPLSAAQWNRFIATNSQSGGDWQEWETFPDKRCCARFFGDSSSLSGFRRMADDGYRLLRQVKRLEDDSKVMVPKGLLVSLPPYDGYFGWLYLLYRTAASGYSDSLRAQPGYWGRTGQVRAEDAEELSPSAGIVVPVHPFYDELPDNLFLSSAKAIDLWLEAEAADLPIILPPEPKANGPARPDSFWLDRHDYQPFGKHEMLVQDATGLWRSADYRVCKDRAGKVCNCSPVVAKLIEVLNLALAQGIPELNAATLLKEAQGLADPALAKEIWQIQYGGVRLDHTFHRNGVWRTLVFPGVRKGCYLLHP